MSLEQTISQETTQEVSSRPINLPRLPINSSFEQRERFKKSFMELYGKEIIQVQNAEGKTLDLGISEISFPGSLYMIHLEPLDERYIPADEDMKKLAPHVYLLKDSHQPNLHLGYLRDQGFIHLVPCYQKRFNKLWDLNKQVYQSISFSNKSS